MDTDRFDQAARQIPAFRELLLRLPDTVKEETFDIRLSACQPVSLWGSEGVRFLRKDGRLSRALTEDLTCISPEQLQEFFLQASGHSVFSHENELKKGYLQLGGGCRVGVCGTAVTEDGRIKSVRDVTGLVFRIPREIRGCGDRLFLEGGDLLRGALIAGEPSSGKTTLLRDLVFSLSSGKFQPSRRVAVLDERGEIGGFDLGPCADVLVGYPKREAFDIAIRMLSPQVIVCDELSPADLEIVRQSVFSGAALVASVHAAGDELYRRPLCRDLLKSGAFHTVACLTGREQPGEIASLTILEDEWDEAVGSCADHTQRSLPGAEKSGGAAKAGDCSA